MSKATDLRDEIREELANYIHSEGCNCCEAPNHQWYQNKLAKLLDVERYDDDSGNNFSNYETKKES